MPETTLPPPPKENSPATWLRWLHQVWQAVRGTSVLNAALGFVANTKGVQTFENKTFTGGAFDSVTLNTPTIVGAVGGTPSFAADTAVAAGAWQTITLVNSWVDHGGYGAAPQYRKLADSNVQVRGGIKNGTATTGILLFTSATGFRPTGKHLHIVAGAGGSHILEVNTDGTVRLYGNPSAINNAEVALTGIVFPTT